MRDLYVAGIDGIDIGKNQTSDNTKDASDFCITILRRAYGLKQFWENNGIKFTATNCEVLICGSGDGRQSGTGLMREKTEKLNQRFLIHILPKPGQTNETKTSNSSHIVK